MARKEKKGWVKQREAEKGGKRRVIITHEPSEILHAISHVTHT